MDKEIITPPVEPPYFDEDPGAADGVHELDTAEPTYSYDLSHIGINAVRYITGHRECSCCNATFKLAHFDRRVIVVHSDLVHLHLSIKQAKQQLSSLQVQTQD